MARPDDRPLKRLPTLAARKDALEKCVFCPKLCRSACPVSNAEPRETLTPWGKMSMAYFSARGDVPLEPSFADPAWACTGCHACKETCDHKNDVATTLLEARSALVEKGLGPDGAKKTIAKFAAHQEATRRGVRELCGHRAVRSDARDAVLIGCSYVRGARTEATHAIDAATALVRGPVAVVEACCGLPLLLAGDAKGFAQQAEAMARATKRAERVLVADAGCAMALRTRYPAVGVRLDARVELLVEVAARELGSLGAVEEAKSDEPVRYHDPCQLGRGLGVYEAPRAILTRALGRAPEEFDARRDKAVCSGGGGLVPVTMPRAARGIADARVAEHERAGGGRIVTACASSLLSFRRSKAKADDIVTWIRAGGAPVEAARVNGERDAPRSAIATRVLASFAVTVVAFAVTVGWSVFAQRRAAADSEELAKGYVPVALKLGQLRATQATIATLVDGIPDERSPLSTKLVLETLSSVRRAKMNETRSAMADGLPAYGSEETQALARALVAELGSIDAELDDDASVFERLFAAIDAGDKDAVNRTIVALGAVEHDADRRFRALADRVASSMDDVSARSLARERRAILALIALAVLTLGVGVAVSIHTRRLLAPLARVTERAQAVARGDLTAREVVATDDEIGQLAAAFERMVAAVARAQSRAVANERLAAIGKMAAHVTHEIRNPLSSIGLNIELLEEEMGRASVPGEAKQLLSSITREVERLEHLSEEYLRVARLPSPRMEADDVATAVTEIVSFARPEIERAGCTVTVKADPSLPPALFDESQLRQALLNLLRNAREAMTEGGAIDVRVSAEGMSVVIAVEDRGGGIPDDIRPRVFDPFFSTKGEGTGLGLAITRQIVEAHGGSVTCDKRDGGGTVFRIALPIAPSRAASIKPRTAVRI